MSGERQKSPRSDTKQEDKEEDRRKGEGSQAGGGQKSTTAQQDDEISRISADGGGGSDQNDKGKNKDDKQGKTDDQMHQSLSDLIGRLPGILEEAEHNEIWGVTLQDGNHVPTVNILIKFLRHNDGDVQRAEWHLIEVLKWRRDIRPLRLMNNVHDRSKFSGLGYLKKFQDSSGGKLVTTWNIYQAVNNVSATFGDSDEFLHWSVALMEMAARKLKINGSQTVMGSNDPYKMVQVHDLHSTNSLCADRRFIDFLDKITRVFFRYYPELVRGLYLVNIPPIGPRRLELARVFSDQHTTLRPTLINDGGNLAREFEQSFRSQFPRCYGGGGSDLESSARTLYLANINPERIEKPSRRSRLTRLILRKQSEKEGD